MDPQKTPSKPSEETDAPDSEHEPLTASSDTAGSSEAGDQAPADFTGNLPESDPVPGAAEESSDADAAAPESDVPPLADASSDEAGEPEPLAGQTFSPAASASETPENPDSEAPESSAPTEETPSSGQDSAPSNAPDVSDPLPEVPDMKPDPLPLAPHKRGRKSLLMVLVTAAVVLLLSGGAAASYYYYVSNKPDSILKQALANSLDPEKIKTVHYSASLTAGDSDFTVNSNFKIAVDGQKGAFDLSGSADALVTTIKFDARSTDGKNYYVKLGGLDGLSELMGSTGMTESFAPLITLINDQWIEINESLIKQASKEAKVSTVLSETDKRKIGEAYMKYPFLVVKEVLPTETIKSQASYHYKVAIDPAMLKTFITALKEAGLDVYKPDQQAIDAANKVIDEAKLDKYPFEVWIAKDSKMFTQYRLEFTDASKAKTDAKLTVESYNQPVNVQKPADAKSVLEIIGEFSKLFQGRVDDPLTDPQLQLPGGISL